jgi:single-stranded-DNA-specific exonuclease
VATEAPAAPQQLWTTRPADPEFAASLADDLGCPVSIAKLLVSRGVKTTDAAKTFFHPTIDDLLDPSLLLGMKEAVARIQQAVAASEPILIYGDYDVDGTTATVLLKTAIERIATKDKPAKVTYHVPHRIREGYGMQTNVLGDAALAGIRLVISVDTGIRAFAAADEAIALGLDLIVTDHHLPDEIAGIPEALAVINPAQEGCPYPFKSLCGAAVAFKLAHALLSAAATTEVDRARLKTAIIPSFLKLVAIATIADSVPLVGENRVIAALGLRELRNPVQPGLRALMQVAQIPLDRAPTATEVGFRLAPRINAAGRMDIASDVVELFLTRDLARAITLAEKLDSLNNDRRATEALALEAIETKLAAMKAITGEYPAEVIILDDPTWHRGVIGILGSRVVDRTARPALILTHEDGQAHGSGRSIEGFHLLDALTAVHDGESSEPVFSRFGGHAHAVGFSLPTANLDRLRDRMQAYSAAFLTAPLLASRLDCDLELPIEEVNETFYGWLERCAPFGNAHPEPIFILRNAVLCAAPRIIKDKHICLTLERPGGAPISALGWTRSIDWRLRCTELSLDPGSRIDLACKLRKNSNPQFGGIELEICGLQLSSSPVSK